MGERDHGMKVKQRGHSTEIERGERFKFGANWERFLTRLDDDRIADAERSLREMLGVEHLKGKRFLDVGSGSGVFSLAARRLGAVVHSFDYDPQSVACTMELRNRYFQDDPKWTVEEGSVLDQEYLGRLGSFDVIYSWGVLHHTGAMWQALDNVAPLVRQGGRLFIAIYNDQGAPSRYWRMVKKSYVKFPLLRWPLVLLHMPYPFLPSLLYRKLSGRSREARGMTFWYDVVDWVGGYPFEVATPRAIGEFYESKGFRLANVVTTSRLGCNQFVFAKETSQRKAGAP